MINSPLGERLAQHKMAKADSLISAGTTDHAFDLLAPLVAEPWLPRRLRVLQMLGLVEDERSVALLQAQLSDDEFVIRWAAAQALAQLGKPTAIEGADKPFNQSCWFCFRCGRDFERKRTAPSAAIIDFYGSESEAERWTGAGGVLCTDCERFLCYECAAVQTVAHKAKCPFCGGRLDDAYIDRYGTKTFIVKPRSDWGR